jgi:cytochrome c-type biogenesis protein CcmH/NrfG
MLQGDTEGAIASYQEVIRIGGDNPEGYYGLGYLYLTVGDATLGIPHLVRAEALYAAAGSPLVGDARVLLAWGASMQGSCLQARSFLAQVAATHALHPIYAVVVEACP